MLKVGLIFLTIGVFAVAQDRIQSGLRDREWAAQAMASRLQTISEAAQRYASATSALRPGVATADITVAELIAAGYLAEGMNPMGPFGGPIEITARTGAYGHVVIDLAIELPDERSLELRRAMSGLDAGGGQTTLQALNGAARFSMPADGNPEEKLRLSGSVKGGQASGDGGAR